MVALLIKIGQADVLSDHDKDWKKHTNIKNHDKKCAGKQRDETRIEKNKKIKKQTVEKIEKLRISLMLWTIFLAQQLACVEHDVFFFPFIFLKITLITCCHFVRSTHPYLKSSCGGGLT